MHEDEILPPVPRWYGAPAAPPSGATLTVSDQQQLADGEATIVARGLAPFVARITSIYDHRALKRRISTEADTVTRHITQARHHDLATTHTRSAATTTGTDFTSTGTQQ